jgi:predicted phage tail protein
MGNIFSGKSSSGQASNQVIPDTSRSIAYGSVIEILCSGGNYGIEGYTWLNPAYQNVYFNQTQFQTANGTFNTQGVQYLQMMRGQPLQPPLQNFDMTLANEHNVNTVCTANTPFVRSFNNANCTAIRLRFAFIVQQNRISNGQVVQVEGSSVSFTVEIQEGIGNAYVLKDTITMSGKWTSSFEKTWTYPVNAQGNQQDFSIRITRTTGVDDINHTRQITWESFCEMQSLDVNLKRMAYVAIRFDSSQFGSSYPDRQYYIGGLYLDIPSNATIDSATGGLNFTGNWDGTFIYGGGRACSDFFPVLWYLLTDETDGLGYDIKPPMIDRYGLYTISKYNNQLIPDGRGGFERRFLFDAFINQQTDGWKVIDAVCASCNVRRYWQNGILKFVQDKQRPITALITNADVVDGFFDYSSTDLDERTTAITVTWKDPKQLFKVISTYYADASLIAKHGYRHKQIEALGCTRKSQALRMAKTIIYSENYETESVTFQARSFAAFFDIGTVIAIADTSRSQIRIGGIIASGSTTTVINVDSPVDISTISGFDEIFYDTYYSDVLAAIDSGTVTSGFDHYTRYGQAEGRLPNGYLIFITLPDLSVGMKRVINSPGTYTNLILESPLTVAPDNNSNWVLMRPDTKPELWAIQSKEISQDNLDIVTITCTQYSQFKYNLIEQNLNIVEESPYVSLPTELPAINNLTIARRIDLYRLSFVASWQPPFNPFAGIDAYIEHPYGYRQAANALDASNIPNPFIVNYFVSISYNNGEFSPEYSTLATNYTWDNLPQGSYRIRVRAIDHRNRFTGYVYSGYILLFYTNVSVDYTLALTSLFITGF